MAVAASEKSQKIIDMVDKTLKGKWPEHPAGSDKIALALLNLPINKPVNKPPVKPK